MVHQRLQSIMSGSAEQYKLILLDYSMPEMDGPTTASSILEEIRKFQERHKE